MNGGAWLTVGGARVDLIYRDLDEVLRWTAAAGEWVLNEKRLTERAGLDAIQDRLAQPGPDLGALVSDVRARLELTDDVWAGG